MRRAQNYQDSGHWQVKPQEKRPVLCLVLLSNFQTSARSGKRATGSARQDGHEACSAQLVHSLRGPVEALGEGRQRPGLRPPAAAASLGSPSRRQVVLTPALAAVPLP